MKILKKIIFILANKFLTQEDFEKLHLEYAHQQHNKRMKYFKRQSNKQLIRIKKRAEKEMQEFLSSRGSLFMQELEAQVK